MDDSAPLSFIDAVLLGFIEGITEFLPISSTGHLIIAGELLGFTGETANTFDVVIQLGAILAVCWHFRERLLGVVRGLPNERNARQFVINLLVALAPAIVFGFLAHDFIKEKLFQPIVVAAVLVIGGIAILIVERMPLHPRKFDCDELTTADALKIGLAQVLAMVPGTSRAGATIIGGMLFGLSRQTATEFSFFLAIPTMFAATGYDLLKAYDSLNARDIGIFAVGFVTAFFGALLAVNGLLHFIRHHDFKAFAWYRIIFGLGMLAYLLR
ncbi:MAG: undecaprenyl-diphosphate phosphatase [Gammaproteobacteria bacterium]|nr:undecaprenyl-diphosphate phosphatase [Gammaproteobacteria bacterium]